MMLRPGSASVHCPLGLVFLRAGTSDPHSGALLYIKQMLRLLLERERRRGIRIGNRRSPPI